MGACTSGRASRTSVIAIEVMRFRMAPGLPPRRSRAPHHAFITSSASGAKRRIPSPSPQRLTTSSMTAARCSSSRSWIRRRRERAVEGEGAGALGVRRREEDRHRPSLVVPEQRRSLGAHGIHHRAHVVHPRLEVGDAAVSVREAGTALVEADEARERGQPFEERCVARLLPVELEVAGEPWHEDEVEWPVARDLVGDRDVAALRIANRASHAAIVAQAALCPVRAAR